MNDLLFIFLVWVLGFGVVGYVLRRPLSSFFIHSRLPHYAGFLVISFPFVVVEESLTCGSFPHCLLVTIPAFWLHLSLFYLVYRIGKMARLRYVTLVICYGLWGSFWEFVVGGKLSWFYEQGLLAFSVLVCLNTLIYTVIVIAPLYYLKTAS